MRDYPADLKQIFSDYQADIENCRNNYKPVDGLFGINHSMKDDICHDRFDSRTEALALEFASINPSPADAGQVIRLLLFPDSFQNLPLSARWTLRAAERHSIPLIPFLAPDDAMCIYQQYTLRYPPRDRLPAQKRICKALLSAAAGERK